MRISIVLSLLILLVFSSCGTAFAYEGDIGYSKIHPASFFYFLKTVRENLELQFAQTTRVKNLRILEFATRRLREVGTLVNINQELIPPTLEKYAALLDRLTDKHQKNDEFATVLQNSLSVHLEVLNKLYQNSSNLRAKMAIRSAMNRVIQRADVPNSAKTPICNLFIKEASSSSLNQTEKAVLSERGEKCLKVYR